MKFTDRETELGELRRLSELSKKRLINLVISGQRRIGKTELVKQFISDKKHLYFFIYEGKTLPGLLTEFQDELYQKKLIDKYTTIKTINDFLDIIFKKGEGWAVIFDEVQNMFTISPDFFSILQRNIDEHKEKKIFFIFLGSLIGLIKKVFEDYRAPLYGRIQNKMVLKPLKYFDCKKMLTSLGYTKEEDFIFFYSLFGGFPKYYVAMEENELKGKPSKVLEQLFFRDNAPLKNEVIDILIQEFGKRKGYYYEILEAIANSNTKLNEIANFVGKHQTEITPFMDDLVNYFEIVERETRITDNPLKTRFSIYKIKNPLVNFWFRFVYPNLRYMELKRFDVILDFLDKELNSYLGRRFEEIIKEVITKEYKNLNLVGRWWGHYRNKEEKREEIEIDIVALNEQTKEILFGECKWQERVDAYSVLNDLKEKAIYVDWFNKERKESYAVFARSFKEKFKEKGVLLFDLKDLKEESSKRLV